MNIRINLFLSVSLLMFSSKLIAQDDDAPSAGEVAKKLADPNASIGFFAFPIDYIHYGGNGEGASSQNAFKISFQPSLPYVIKPGKNIFVRPLIPIIISQPIITEDGSFQDEGVDLGDIGFDAAYGITWPNKLITIFGMVGSAPTATDKKLGTGRWMLGPEVFLGKTTKWGMFGVLVTHSWSVNKNNSGAHDQLVTPDDFMFINDVYYPDNNQPGGDNTLSVTSGQYFYTLNLKNAWQIQSQPTFTYNHKAESGNRFTFPIGTGVAKTIVAGKMPLKFSVQYWYYTASPNEFGPRHQIRFQFAPVIPLPW